MKQKIALACAMPFLVIGGVMAVTGAAVFLVTLHAIALHRKPLKTQ